MTLTVGRTMLAGVAVVVAVVSSVRAQQPEPGGSAFFGSVGRTRAALQSSQEPMSGGRERLFAPSKPDEFRLGVQTFLPPDTPGQFVSIRIPVGALASRAAHSIAAAQHRRAEKAAREEVAKALAEFWNAQPK